ncbi:MAG: hypothetical protein HQK76_08370 [Desulfobacterales bacterium]|nr:hypothetical protein [Desulfobacterales bacterium]
MKNAILAGIINILIVLNSYALEIGEVNIHGYISQGYMQSDKNNYIAMTEDGTFKIKEVGFNISTEFTSNFRAGLQVVSVQMGEIGGNEPKIDWAYGDYRWNNYIGIRIGKMKNPIGLYNETKDLDAVHTSIFLPSSAYIISLRDSLIALDGVGLYGNIPIGLAGSLSYYGIRGTTTIEDNGSTAKYISSVNILNDVSVREGDSNSAKITWHTPLDGLKFAGSIFQIELYIKGKTTDHYVWPVKLGMDMDLYKEGKTLNAEYNIKPYEVKVLSCEYALGNFTFAAEGNWTDSHREFDLKYPDGKHVQYSYVGPSLGYYTSGYYRFLDKFELGIAYGEYFIDRDDKDGKKAVKTYAYLKSLGLVKEVPADYNFWHKDLTLTFRYDINENFIFKLEGHLMDGAAQLMKQDNPDGVSRNWFLFVSKVTFIF